MHEGSGNAHGSHRSTTTADVLRLSFLSLGVVYGDIGTSPLYTLKECLHVAAPDGGMVDRTDLFGVLSLMFWALLLVVTVKYIVFVMRADHGGEGGILALLALVPERFRHSAGGIGGVSGMTLLAVIGASLLYGDGVITPAISVLSAVEGLAVASPALKEFVVPITCLILVGLFAIQSRGTGDVGRLFGPVMLVWFATLALLGLGQIVQEPQILAALSPGWGIEFFARHGLRGILILGSVVLVVTGGEALYADMGHFGIKPIRLAWSVLVLPALVLAYLGQGALILRDPSAAAEPFFRMVPLGAATWALVILSSLATVIASQALISGAFSLTRQAMLQGFLPRMTIRHTAADNEGQIYIPEVNALLAIGCLALVLTFRESVKLAAAYGIAVTGTMAVTSILYYLVARHNWGWGKWRSIALLVFFLALDIPFLAANLFKFFDGGYVPMLIGSALIAGMLIWTRGRTAVIDRYSRQYGPWEKEWPRLKSHVASRVPGGAVFLAPSADNLPPLLVHHLELTRAIQETVVLLTVTEAPTPGVAAGERAVVQQLGDGFWRVDCRFGYMEEPLVVPLLATIVAEHQIPLDVAAATYFIGHATIVAGTGGWMSHIPEAIFAYLKRNAVQEERRYHVPPDRVIEVGEQISL